MYSLIVSPHNPEPVFVNVYGAQESTPRNRFRQPMYPGRQVRHIGLSYRPDRLWIYIPGLLKRYPNTGLWFPLNGKYKYDMSWSSHKTQCAWTIFRELTLILLFIFSPFLLLTFSIFRVNTLPFQSHSLFLPFSYNFNIFSPHCYTRPTTFELHNIFNFVLDSEFSYIFGEIPLNCLQHALPPSKFSFRLFFLHPSYFSTTLFLFFLIQNAAICIQCPNVVLTFWDS
jgi:hypothetical protein